MRLLDNLKPTSRVNPGGGVTNCNIETKVPLEVFHRHIVITHAKDAADKVLCELEQQAQQSSESVARLLADWVKRNHKKGEETSDGWQDDNWWAKEVLLEKCYFAQTDFRGYSVPKDERFIDFLPAKRREIESGSFPCSSQILAQWHDMPEPLAQERDSEKYYILDGQLRVMRHWYHNVTNVRVFIYKGKGNV